ncbi:MAG: electron transport complex subunit RsxC [Clostridia bacterium]|nr:electron transport complex subunit RsxC [Clostridia bacterium]
MRFTFKGGTHVNEYKNTAACAVRVADAPQTVAIPLSQHIGAHAKPTVEVGERVLVGQIIGEVAEGLGCPVHSSVSGTVKEIKSINNAQGVPMQSVVIENDGQNELSPDVCPRDRVPEDCSGEEIVEIVREAGISGMGGATFPTYAKLRGALGRTQHMIVNCAECEPFITANHRLMLEEPETLLLGVRVLLCALGLDEATVAIEDNKMDAVKTLEEIVRTRGEELLGGKRVTIAVMKTKYPQGDERQLIYALMKKEIPAGKLPVDVGCIIFNAETCAAVKRAFFDGMPLISRRVTVDGDCIAQPGNLLAPVGMSYANLAQECGGFVKIPEKVINGGPMMGAAQWDLEGSVTKGTSAVLFLSEDFVRPTLNHSACIHCGRCANRCPMHLMPFELTDLARKRQFDEALKYDIMSCVECGSCSYGCPAGVEIVQYIRAAKGAIRQKQAAERAKDAQKK